MANTQLIESKVPCDLFGVSLCVIICYSFVCPRNSSLAQVIGNHINDAREEKQQKEQYIHQKVVSGHFSINYSYNIPLFTKYFRDYLHISMIKSI